MNTFQLPLPNSNKIAHICHISDIHIRNGDSKNARFEEYNSVFQRIISFLTNHPNKDSMAIVITGDIFHNKSSIGPAGTTLFLDFVNSLGNIAPTYLIRGNHDYRQDKPDEIDMISPLVGNYNKNVQYLDSLGYYIAGDVGFALMPIQNTLDPGNTSGSIENMPSFPSSSNFPDSVKHKIALFHGSIPQRIPLEWFGKGYDYILLGDIHMQQLFGCDTLSKNITLEAIGHDVFHVAKFMKREEETMWGYPGSTIQQGIGETMLGHGMIMWNIEEQTADMLHVKNDWACIDMVYSNEEWKLNLNHPMLMSKGNHVSLESVASQEWFPKYVYVRFKGGRNTFDDYNEISALLDKHGIQHNSIKSAPNDFDNDTSNESVNQELKLTDINTKDTWVQFIEESLVNDNIDVPYSKWHQWFDDPNNLLLPPLQTLSVSFESKIDDKNKKIASLIEDFNNATNQTLHTSRHGSFKLHFMKWSYILCYSENCYIDFQKLHGKIACINGKNATGKTSLLETICIAIFGVSFPSRTNRTYSSSFICQQKPKTARSMTSIVFEIDGQYYRLNRGFVYQQDDNTKILVKDTSLEKRVENNSFVEVHKGKLAIDNWVRENVGDVHSFLMSTMITQAFDSDFFALTTKEQRDKIDNALCLQSSTVFKDLLHTSYLAYKDLLKDLEICHSMLANGNSSKFKVEELNNAKARSDTLSNEIQEVERCIAETDGILRDADFDLLKQGDIALRTLVDGYNKDICKYDDKDDVSIDDLLCHKGKLNNEFDIVKNFYVRESLDSVEFNLKEHIDNKPEKPSSLNLDYCQDEIEALENKLKSTKSISHLEKEKDVLFDNLKKFEVSKSISTCEIRNTRNAIQKSVEVKEKRLQEWHDILANKVPQPMDSQEDYDKWLDDIETFGDKYESLESLRQKLNYLEEPDCAKPTITFNEVDNTKNIVANWREKVKGAIKVDPFSKAFETLQVSSKRKEEDLYCVCVEDSEVVASLQDELNTKLKEKEVLQNELTNVIKNNIQKPLYYGRKADKNSALKKFKELQKKVLKQQIVIETYDIPLQENIAQNSYTLISAYNIAKEKFQNNKDLLGECEQFPFNPKCEACQQQPWRLKVVELEKKVEDASNCMKDIENKMDTLFGKFIDGNIFENANKIMKEFNDYNSMLPDYQTQKAFWDAYDKQELEYTKWVQSEKELNNRLATLSKNTKILEKDLEKCKGQHNAHKIELQEVKHNNHILQSYNAEICEYKSMLDSAISNELSLKLWDAYNEKRARLLDEIGKWEQLERERCRWNAFNTLKSDYASWLHKEEAAKVMYEEACASLSELEEYLASLELEQNDITEKIALTQKAHDDFVVALGNCKKQNDELKALYNERDSINAWLVWEETLDKLKNSIQAITSHQRLQECEKKIQNKRKVESIRSKLKQVEDALNVYPLYIKFIDSKQRLDSLRKTYFDLQVRVADLQNQHNVFVSEQQQASALQQYIRNVNDICISIKSIEDRFANFKTWVFKTKAMPIICNNVNMLLQMMCRNHRNLFLECKVGDDGNFTWFLKDGVNTPLLEKASGFQRFIVSLALRITLGRLGISGMSSRQLFIDEGFTACDLDNLACVPEFLQGLLGTYDMVLIVSHLDDLKTAYNDMITIQRDESLGLSFLALGDRNNPLMITKKIGRPSKVKN